MRSTRTNFEHDRRQFLTLYAFSIVEKELLLLTRCRGIQQDRCIFYVYTPTDNIPDPQNKLPPRFYRLRKIEIIDDRFTMYEKRKCI